MRSFCISTRLPGRRWRRASRRSLSMPRSASWSGISRTTGVNGSRPGGRWRSAVTISRTRISGTRSRTACTTSGPATRGWSRSVSATTRARSRSTRSARGGSTSAAGAIPRRAARRSPLMAAAATRAAPACGRPSCRSSPNEIGIPIRVCHFPPGTSKWNKIEHRMFSYVSLNWRGRPLESLEVIIDLWPHCDGLNWPHLSVRWAADCSSFVELEREAPEGMGSRVEQFEQIRRDRDREGPRSGVGGPAWVHRRTVSRRWRRRCRRRRARRWAGRRRSWGRIGR